MKLIIPMAGRGTRVRPHSHVTPKPLLSVRGTSIVERIVDTFSEAIEANIDTGVFVLGPDFGQEVRDDLTDICERNDMEAQFAVQEEALGTAHAVGSAAEYLSGSGIVVFADTLFGMSETVSLEGADVTMWVREVDDPSRFGVAVREGEQVVRLVEKPDEPISNEAIIGIYHVDDLAWLHQEIKYLIKNNIRGKGGEYQLTDAFDRMLQDGAVFKTASVDAWMDCGTIPSLLNTTRRMLEREPDDDRQGTVTNSIIHEPVYIGPDAEVKNAVVGPNVSIEQGARVEGAVMRDSIVFAEGTVSNAVLKDTLVGQHATVDPGATVLNVGDHSYVGPRS
jgi:glucose-1-phosphate thymidylyltransferase